MTILNKIVLSEYRRLRKLGWQAKWAFTQARTRAAWEDMNGFIYDGDERGMSAAPGESIYCPGPVRLILEYDEMPYDDSYIDTWDDCSDNEKEREHKELWERIERDGVWTLVGQYWNGHIWVDADSCGGFIGDDWKDSGYDADIMAETISQYDDYLKEEARQLEAMRPDMYEGAYT